MNDIQSAVHPVHTHLILYSDGTIYSSKTKKLLRGSINKKLNYTQVGVWLEGKSVLLYLHRLVLESFVGECPDGYYGDHIDRNRQNNELSNLRWCTPKENQENTSRGDEMQIRKSMPRPRRKKTKGTRSGFAGVEPFKFWFRARITIDGKLVPIGSFQTAEEAARAYDAVAKNYPKKTLNFPE